MDNNIIIKSKLITSLLVISIGSIMAAQVDVRSTVNAVNDSLSLQEIINRAVTTYPSVKVAEEAINNATARINLAKTGYYPEVDMNANFSNIGPVTKFNIPEMGTIQFFPENNYSASLNYRQVIYDFGRTKQNIAFENENRAMGEQTLEQTKQKLSLTAVSNFYTLLFLQSAIKIKDEELQALQEHLNQINKMMETGSATEYQVLSTKVRISAVESQKVDLESAINTQQALLNTLIGNDQTLHPVVMNELNTPLPDIPEDSMVSFAMGHRDEVILNRQRTTLAELKYGITKLQYRPVLSLAASGGAKNGYMPELSQFKPNYTVGLGIRVPIFDGLKTKYNLAQAKSAITSLSYESDYIKRNVSSELVDAETYMIASEKKVAQYSLQLDQALKAYSLAKISFNSGVITNLDLLDSSTSVSESRLLLLKARIDYAVSIFKYKAALGERIY
jgi:outer membrane protein